MAVRGLIFDKQSPPQPTRVLPPPPSNYVPRPTPEEDVVGAERRSAADLVRTERRMHYRRRGDNLVIDGSFEDGGRGWSLEPTMSVQADPARAYHGRAYLECTSIGGRDVVARQEEFFQAAPGDVFIMVAAFGGSVGAAASGAACRIAWFDQNFSFLSTSALLSSTGTAWNRQRAAFAAPASTAFGNLEYVVFDQTSGSLRLDDVRLKYDQASDAGAAAIDFALSTALVTLANGRKKVVLRATIQPVATDVSSIAGRYREVGGNWRRIRIDEVDDGTVMVWEGRGEVEEGSNYEVELWPMYEGRGRGTRTLKTITTTTGEDLGNVLVDGTSLTTIKGWADNPFARGNSRGDTKIRPALMALKDNVAGTESFEDLIEEVGTNEHYLKRGKIKANSSGTLQTLSDIFNGAGRVKRDKINIAAESEPERLMSTVLSDGGRYLAPGLANRATGDMDAFFDNSINTVGTGAGFVDIGDVTIECRKGTKVLVIINFLVRTDAASDADPTLIDVRLSFSDGSSNRNWGVIWADTDQVPVTLIVLHKPSISGGDDDVGNITYTARVDAASQGARVSARCVFAMTMKQVPA